jgi:hypothetical protein
MNAISVATAIMTAMAMYSSNMDTSMMREIWHARQSIS